MRTCNTPGGSNRPCSPSIIPWCAISWIWGLGQRPWPAQPGGTGGVERGRGVFTMKTASASSTSGPSAWTRPRLKGGPRHHDRRGRARGASGGKGRARENVYFTNFNSPRQIVLGGGTKEVLAFKEELAAEGYWTYPLKVSMAFHSPSCGSSGMKWQALGDTLTFHPPQIPVISNTTQKPFPDDPEEIRTSYGPPSDSGPLAAKCRDPVA